MKQSGPREERGVKWGLQQEESWGPCEDFLLPQPRGERMGSKKLLSGDHS